MTLEASFDVYGTAATIKRLDELEPELGKQARATLAEAVAPVVQVAQAFTPNDAPLSGWGRSSWRRWTPGKAKRAIRTKVATSAKRGREIRLVSIIQPDPSGAIYEFAGAASSGSTANGQRFIAALTDRGGKPGRAVWKAVDANNALIVRAVAEAAANVEQTLTERLAR